MHIVPNSYQKPNLYTDKLMAYLTGDEWKTLDYALRRTFGFQKQRDRISVSQFMNGNGRLDDEGAPVELGTGLSRPAQIQALNELMRFGILIEIAPDSQKRGRLWMLQLDESLIRFDLLSERASEQKALGRQRTAKARASRPTAAAAIGQSDIPVESVSPTNQHRLVPLTNIGQSDLPVSVSPANPQKPRRNKGETQTESQSEAGEAAVVSAWRLLVNLCGGNEAVATDVWRLQEKFTMVTRLKRPDPATDAGREKLVSEWWPHLRQVLAEADNDLAVAEAAMQEAFQSMTERPKPLTVSGPRSIVNVTNAVLAGKRRGPNVGAGKQRPKGFAGLEAYASRRGLNNGS